MISGDSCEKLFYNFAAAFTQRQQRVAKMQKDLPSHVFLPLRSGTYGSRKKEKNQYPLIVNQQSLILRVSLLLFPFPYLYTNNTLCRY